MNNPNPEIVSASIENLLDIYPRGARAVGLLVAGRNLVARFMVPPGIGAEECRNYIAEVDAILGPLERTSEGASEGQVK